MVIGHHESNPWKGHDQVPLRTQPLGEGRRTHHARNQARTIDVGTEHGEGPVFEKTGPLGVSPCGRRFGSGRFGVH